MSCFLEKLPLEPCLLLNTTHFSPWLRSLEVILEVAKGPVSGSYPAFTSAALWDTFIGCPCPLHSLSILLNYKKINFLTC